MIMNSDSVIEGFNLFKNELIGLAIGSDTEPIKPFSFDQGMEEFNAGIIVSFDIDIANDMVIKGNMRERINRTDRGGEKD